MITFRRTGERVRQCDPISAPPLTEVPTYIRLELGSVTCQVTPSARIHRDQVTFSCSKLADFRAKVRPLAKRYCQKFATVS